ncbi:MAG TPA: hypothetical protein VFQ45_05390 [Longimicrobium sp.]|nr:hypothetical protein [Longimicrobium sp.]
MRFLRSSGALAFALVLAAPAHGQSIQCVDPPVAAPAETACRVQTDPGAQRLRLVLQLRTADGKPLPPTLVSFETSNGDVIQSGISDVGGYITAPWSGVVADEPITVTATATHDGTIMRRQIRIARRAPATAAVPYIEDVAPSRGHSSYAGKYLTDPVEVQIEADAATCQKTQVVVEYLSIANAATPQPQRWEVPALWSELDPGRFECAAQFKWLLSSAVGEQELRVWIKRDSTFVLPTDPAGAQRYLRPHVVHAVAHPQPSLLVGAALVEGSDTTELPRIVGLDLSFPNVADLLKQRGAIGAGKFIDHVRVMVGTNFSTDDKIGRQVYLGIEPVVLMIGPRIADLPVALSAGRRFGQGKDRWFAAGFINGSAVLTIAAKALGISL